MTNLQDVKRGDLLVTKRGCVWVIDPDKDDPRKFLRSVRSERWPDYRYDRFGIEDDEVVQVLKWQAGGGYTVHNNPTGELPDVVLVDSDDLLSDLKQLLS